MSQPHALRSTPKGISFSSSATVIPERANKEPASRALYLKCSRRFKTTMIIEAPTTTITRTIPAIAAANSCKTSSIRTTRISNPEEISPSSDYCLERLSNYYEIKTFIFNKKRTISKILI